MQQGQPWAFGCNPCGPIGTPMRIGRRARAALAGAHAGRVVSAHRRAVNIRLDTGDIITLLPAPRPLHPWAIAPVAGIAALRREDFMTLDGGRLQSGLISLRWTEATLTDLRITTRPSLPVDSAALLLLEDALQCAPGDSCDEEKWVRLRIASALHEFAHGGKPAALASLTGVGFGLTPSGDDVIVGALAALDFASVYAPAAPDLRSAIIHALPYPLSEHTPLLSAQMLVAACEGQYPEPLRDLAHTAAHQESPAELSAALREQIAMGHRSGFDMLAGFVSAVYAAAGDLADLDLPTSRSNDPCP